jgi:glutathione synthase/RimK-type ligase-like ATP-grasp enzyme
LVDIRVVVFRGFPIMAMTRIPTKRSEGKANIHQGALAAGITISEGRIHTATCERRTVRKHPSTGRELIGFRFNEWETILETASAAAMAMDLGYVGVDLTVDENKGVLVIEVNRRPGLEIQNANRSGLLKRIRYAERMWRTQLRRTPDLGPGIRVELARSWDRTDWGRRKEGYVEE